MLEEILLIGSTIYPWGVWVFRDLKLFHVDSIIHWPVDPVAKLQEVQQGACDVPQHLSLDRISWQKNLVIDRGFLEGLVWYLSFQSRGGLHTALWICWRSIWRWGSDGEHRLPDRKLTCCLCLVFCLWNSWPTCYKLIADAGSLRMDAVGVRGWSCCMVPQWVSEIIKPTVKHI